MTNFSPSPGLAPAVLVLAAGRAQRFGADKRMALLAGKPLIGHVLDALLGAAIPAGAIHICIGPEDNELSEYCLHHLGQADRPAGSTPRLLACPNAYAGMGYTLADAVSATADAAGWLVCLADMPFVQASTYAALWAQTSRHTLLAPCWQGQRGHPVFFAQQWREPLSRLRGDAGARSLLAQHHEHLALLSVDDPGITLDIDTPSDLNRPLIL